ncbi:cupin domain-containing protein [Micromonospora sp. HUAS LYJ1]|uniref:JmjC domain-containing protein n=1 Tax=Micromonospora sp. HUAS LYJ1 TaxID=3061626 RepID=UPI0026728F24|nr:cupin domain-containing protein [Micromonospora sp. HUAS LYJ1]WKU07159.1 cupin domain-containing protein [Micromonospora sp. HUAS LYJ1]
MILGPELAAAVLGEWPESPRKVRLPNASPIGRAINARTIRGFLDAGCAPSNYVNVFHHGEGLHPARFTADDRVAPASVQLLLDQGCTIQLRELNRWFPPLSAICASIQAETGYSGYVTAFITPPSAQGLDYHWDQYLGIVVQLDGAKTWELFAPKVDAPYRDHSMSTNLWRDEWVEQWRQAGPDQTVKLAAGDVLVLPRGWVHNPHSLDATKTSVHLTFVLKERVPLWIAERLIGSAIRDPRFRAVIPPRELGPEEMPGTVENVRSLMIDYLTGLDVEELSGALLRAAQQETSHAML